MQLFNSMFEASACLQSARGVELTERREKKIWCSWLGVIHGTCREACGFTLRHRPT